MMRARFASPAKRLIACALVASLLAASLETASQAAGKVAASPETHAGAPSGRFALAAVGRLVEQAVTALPDLSLSLNPAGEFLPPPGPEISGQLDPGWTPQNVPLRSVDAGVQAFLERARQAGPGGIDSGAFPEISRLPRNPASDASPHARILEQVSRALAPFKAEDIRRMPLETLDGIARGIWENRGSSGAETLSARFPASYSPVLQTPETSVLIPRGNPLLPTRPGIDESLFSRGPPEQVADKDRKTHAVKGVRNAQTTAMIVFPVTTFFSLAYSQFGKEAFTDKAFAIPPALLAAHFAIVYAFWTSRFHHYPKLTPQGRRAFITAFDGLRWSWAAVAAGAVALWAHKGLPSNAAPENLARTTLWFLFGLPWVIFAVVEMAHHLFYRVRVNNGDGDTGKLGFSNRVGGNIGRQLARMQAVWERNAKGVETGGL